ncbi:MAG: hypothetical protein NZ700_05605 [Gemmataceae bacterium]|nr:hypothetical protein [Gemmataceae bacterium]MDW8266125.1 hypothetical protein [Gemmataceae bacterium]
MAVVAEPAKPATRHEAYIEAELARVRQRIRLYDVATAVLLFLAGLLAFTLTLIFLDHSLVLPAGVRQAALLAFVVAAGAYLAMGVIRPFCRRVNAYYAARELERTVPDAKNSVVNWLDLRDERLPAAIRVAIGQRAARDLAQADVEEAVSSRRVLAALGLAAALLAAAIGTVVILRPAPFFSLLARTFVPFREGAILTRTRIQLLEPAGGDAVVPIHQPVNFAVRVEGKVPDPRHPDALKLRFRYARSELVWQERPLELLNPHSQREWGTRLPAYQVHNGFWYKITGGDFETPEYRVQVRSGPLVTDYEVTYHYRPYLRWRDVVTRDPNLEGLRGTAVTILARTNRQVAEGRLLIEGRPPILAEKLPDRPDSLLFRLVLDRDGQYVIRFTSKEGEENPEPLPYRIKVIRDAAPRVQITKPEQEISLPANGVLEVEGLAVDDVGLTKLQLRLRVEGGDELAAKPYREGKSFRFDDGTYPQTLDYQDFVKLDQLQDAQGRPKPLQPGMVLEYWLEAVDNCDYPEANIGRSQTQRVQIAKPDDPQRQEKRQKEAEQRQQQHAQKQDEKLDEENAQHQPTPEDRPTSKTPEQPEARPDDARQGEQQRELEEQARRIQEELDKQQSQDTKGQTPEARGTAKEEPQPTPKGDAKAAPEPKPAPSGEAKPQPEDQAACGQCKGQPKDRPGSAKSTPQEGSGDSKPQPGREQAAGASKEQPSANPSREPGDASSGQAKAGPKPEAGRPGQSKDGGKPGPMKDGPGQPKGAGTDVAEKPGRPRGEAKGEPSASAKAAAKDAGKGGDRPTQPEGEPKGTGTPRGSAQTPKGEAKDSSAPGQAGSGVVKGEAKEPSGSATPGNNPGVGKKTATGSQGPNSTDPDALKRNLLSDDAEKRKEAIRELAHTLGELRKNTDLAKGDELRRRLAEATRKADKGDLAKDIEAGDREKVQKTLEEMARSGDPKDKEALQELADAIAQPPTSGMEPSQGRGEQQPNGPQGGMPRTGGGANAGQPNGSQRTEPGTPQQPGGSAPGGGGDRRDDASGRGPGDQPGPPEPPDPRHAKRPGELQLQRFRDQVTPEMLEKLKMTKEDFERFLRSYEAVLQRQPPAAPSDKPTGPQRGGPLPNLGPRQVQGSGTEVKNVSTSGPALPPPELRDAYREFTEGLAKMKRPDKK